MSQTGLLLHHVLFEAAKLSAEIVQLPCVEVTGLASLMTSWRWCHTLLRLLLVILLRHEVKLASEWPPVQHVMVHMPARPIMGLWMHNFISETIITVTTKHYKHGSNIILIRLRQTSSVSLMMFHSPSLADKTSLTSWHWREYGQHQEMSAPG